MQQEKENKLEFIDFVLSIGDDNLPIDKSVQLDFLQYRLDEIEECMEDRFDILEKKINTIMKYLDQMNK
jgi:hypothetical protein